MTAGRLPLRVLAVFAHPDDESVACGGTLARLSDAGALVTILCATCGERGGVADPSLLGDDPLGVVRERELRCAAGVLGASHVQVLGHPDALLPWLAPEVLETHVRQSIRQHQPDVVITFHEDGLYWHPDHIAVHQRVTAVVAQIGADAPALYYVTMPAGAMRTLVEMTGHGMDDRGVPRVWGIPADAFGVSAASPSLVIDVRDWVPRKLEAIRCHRTQISLSNPFSVLTTNDAARVLGTEHLTLAAFSRDSSAFVATCGGRRLEPGPGFP